MVGSWRWNGFFGGFGAALVFLFSLSRNPIGTTLLRSFYAFVAFFLIALAIRFVLGVLLHPSSGQTPEGKLEEERGAVLDMVTPDDDESLTEMLKEQWTDGSSGSASGFKPLAPKRLVSIDDADPEQVVQAIRRLNDE
ncbi:hypothetical protein ACFPVX_12480 [Cohnella faecalis]|uniref:Uncharacterized protein n=1 Tax=Cohnella faecalis TaxID=2315694 RepID=A0A398CR92_9BACL|nr:hypothetical protein [Cohnella faecalis]RIE03308.1 hypothetical protein D3H35_11505 [Cohnella faecalis]